MLHAGAVPEQKPLLRQIDVFGCTHRGLVRATNADHFLVASFHRAEGALPETRRTNAADFTRPAFRRTRFSHRSTLLTELSL